MDKNTMDKVNELICRYEKDLTEKGVACKAIKRYFESAVMGRTWS